MRGLIVEVSPISENTTIAHVRNCLEINKKLKFDIVSGDKQILAALKKQYDVLLFSYSSKFAPHELMERLCEKNKNAKFIWMFNDYAGSVPVCLRKKGDIIVICNNDKMPNKNYDYAKQWHTVNLNSLLIGEKIPIDKKYDFIYYGTYRPDREKYFKKYFHEPMMVSSSVKNHKLFRHIGCNPRFIDVLNWMPKKETLRLFRYSLFIEDEKTHSHYSHLPNRFYESWWCGCLPIVDISCENSIKKSGIDFYDFLYIESLADFKKFDNTDFKKHQKIFDEKIGDFFYEEKKQTLNKIIDIVID